MYAVVLGVDRLTIARTSDDKHLCNLSGAPFTAAILIAPPTLAYAALALQQHPLQGQNLAHDAPLLAPALTLPLALLTLRLVSTADPGVLTHELAADAAPPMHAASTTDAGDFCTRCGAHRPARAHHCRHTRACIDTWDHYCPFVGNAVGRGNYRLYIAFVSAAMAHAALISWCAALELRSGLAHATLPLLTLLYCVPVFLLLAHLASYHFYLISVNKTTYECNRARSSPTETRNPHDLGFLANWASFCGGREPRAPGSRGAVLL